MFYLKNNRLNIEIAEPGEAPNNNSRFAWAGLVTEIILDGFHRFGASEPNHLGHPSSNGRGLECEYTLDCSNEVNEGEYFPKFGIGLLKKDDAPYTFYKIYETIPFPIEIEKTETKAVFKVHPIECLGYALEHTKTLEIVENKLIMTEEIKNVGTRDFCSTEYCHNFLTVNGLALSPQYHFRLPDLKSRGKGIVNQTVRGDGYGYTFLGYNHDPAYFILDGNELQNEYKGPVRWEMYNFDASGKEDGAVGVKAFVDVKEVDHMLFWSVDHMMSFEVFHKINLKPGESDKWSREWEFYD